MQKTKIFGDAETHTHHDDVVFFGNETEIHQGSVRWIFPVFAAVIRDVCVYVCLFVCMYVCMRGLYSCDKRCMCVCACMYVWSCSCDKRCMYGCMYGVS